MAYNFQTFPRGLRGSIAFAGAMLLATSMCAAAAPTGPGAASTARPCASLNAGDPVAAGTTYTTPHGLLVRVPDPQTGWLLQRCSDDRVSFARTVSPGRESFTALAALMALGPWHDAAGLHEDVRRLMARWRDAGPEHASELQLSDETLQGRPCVRAARAGTMDAPAPGLAPLSLHQVFLVCHLRDAAAPTAAAMISFSAIGGTHTAPEVLEAARRFSDGVGLPGTLQPAR